MNKQESLCDYYDEDLYKKAVNELKLGSFSEALWAKALAKTGFDEAQAKAKYVDLRVEQMKRLIALEQQTIEQEAENRILQDDLETVKKGVKKAQRKLEDAKLEAVIDNVITSPLLMFQVLLLSGFMGLHEKSWILFFIAIFVLCTILIIPVLSSLAGFLMSCLFGYVGYVLGTEWFGDTGGYWAGGITFMVVLGANFELLDKNKEVRSISSHVDDFD